MLSTRINNLKRIINKVRVPSYTFDQIIYAIYKKGVVDYTGITTVQKQLRIRLKEELGEILALKKIYELTGGQAHKVLFETRDGQRIETVLMIFRPGDDMHESLCISSQSGCALGCKFCATGAIGFKKNLTGEEISDQVLYFRSRGFVIGSISFMGMGEPFSNTDNVFEALRIITKKDFLGMSPRKISISTVGIIPGIKRLTKEYPQVNLAFSLHSPFSQQRLELMPITRTYPIEEVFKVLDEHILMTNKRVFIAYVLLGGVNDSPQHANAVVNLIKRRGKTSYLYHVNLIRYHPGPTIEEFKKPASEKIDMFMDILGKGRISCSLRQSFGVKIYAACGQLYGKYDKNDSFRRNEYS